MPDGRGGIGLALALVALAAVPATGAAQWRLDASIGSFANEALADDLDSNNIVLGTRKTGTNWFYATAGLPLDAAGSSWAAAGSGGELLIPGSVDYFGVSGNVEGWAFGGDLEGSGWGALAEVGPFLSASVGPLDVSARSGVIHYRATASDLSNARTLSSSGLTLSVPGAGPWQAGSELRYLRGYEGGFGYAGAFFSAEVGSGGAWGRAGRWMSDRIPRPEWSAGAYLAVSDRVRIESSVRQDTNDPLFWTEPRRSWSVGVSYAVSRAPAPPPLLPVIESGRALIRVPVSESGERPLIAGDFSGWETIPMVREGAYWTVAISVQPGIYHYSFQTADGEWFLPPSTITRVDDGFGGENAVLVVQ